jgi:hypothetical protein
MGPLTSRETLLRKTCCVLCIAHFHTFSTALHSRTPPLSLYLYASLASYAHDKNVCSCQIHIRVLLYREQTASSFQIQGFNEAVVAFRVWANAGAPPLCSLHMSLRRYASNFLCFHGDPGCLC